MSTTESVLLEASVVTTTPGVERKAFEVTALKMRQDDAPGTFEAVVSVFGNVDQGGDVVMPGAFERTLAEWAAKERLPAVVWSHDWDNVIGRTLALKETREGLFVKARLYVEDEASNADARRVHYLLKDGAVGEFSFGYAPREVAYEQRDGQDVRLIKDLDLFEVSPTLVGMNPATRLVGIKAAEPSAKPEEATLGQPVSSVSPVGAFLLGARPTDRRDTP